MHHLKWLIIFVLFFFNIFSSYSQRPKVELAGTEVIRFTSAIDSHQYVLYINLPDNYAKANKKYPVLYVTDGQWFFASMYVGYGGQHYDGLVPDLITVGITWPDNFDANRRRDFTPNKMEGMPGSGNAPKFLAVIKNEIIKIIDSTYRVQENDKALYGTSLGGLFALYTLFHEPTLFNRYIIISPSLDWDNELLFKYEKSFAAKNKTLNAKIFISSGEYEEASSSTSTFKKFVDQVKASKYKGLELESMVVNRMGHSGSGTVGGIIGLQSIYSKPVVKLANSVLDQYAGHYLFGNDTLSVSRSGSDLYGQSGFGKSKLLAETAETFYIKGVNASLQFKKDSKQKVSGYDLMLSDTTLFFKKLD
ncbi:MAG: alpha/beta hydrolase-fold protein [Chitinophagaceae bacterium]